VLYPNVVAYKEGMTIRDYINNAGGYADRAKRTKVYVVYMNNTIEKGQGSKIEPGCEIVVPLRRERHYSGVWGDIATAASSILSVASMTIVILLNLSRLN
jgi:hypothetical protein